MRIWDDISLGKQSRGALHEREILRSYNIYDIKSLSQQKLTATLDTEQVFLHSSSVLISKQYKQTCTWVDEP
jgi:hypothetical protein